MNRAIDVRKEAAAPDTFDRTSICHLYVPKLSRACEAGVG
jgi:hypothetical protein